MKKIINAKAQLTMEYLLLTMFVLIAIILMALKSNSPFQQTMFNALQERAVMMEVSATVLDGRTSDLGFLNCGNGAIEVGEMCDGSDLAGQTCVTLGFSGGGSLFCTVGCMFNTSACVP